MKSPPQPQRQARLHSQTRARSFVAPPTPKRLSAAVPRKSFVNDSSNKLTVEFLWDRFDELGPEQDWTLSQNVDTSRAMADVLVSRYKDRNVAGSILFAAVEYCAHIVDHEGVPDNWRRVRRSVEDIPLIMRAVFEAKADPTAEASHTKGRMRAMHYAAGLGTVPVLQALLEGTESVGEQAPGESVQSQIINVRSLNERNQEHYTPLHDAVWFKKYEATKWLLMHRADANAQNFMGWTPMHIVARQGTNLEFVRLLIDHGADLRRQDKAGDNPLMTAVNKPLFPVNKFHLLASSCYDQKSTFLAYLRDIYTLALENEQAAEEFVAVLLGRHHMGESAENDHQDTSTSDEDSDGQLKERPLRFMQSVDSATARSDQESDKALAMMAEVMEKAPRAAAMILDVLVGDPMVACPEHHPLPLRANMLIDGCEETMICDYQPDYFEEEDDTDEELSWVSRVANNNRKHIKRPGPGKRFEKRSANSGTSSTETDGGWESLRRNLLPKVQVVKNLEEVYRHKCRLPCWRYDTLTNTGPEWHNSLAPMTEKRNDDKEVQIEVLKMPDLLDIKVIRVLAHTPHLDLFARISNAVPLQPGTWRITDLAFYSDFDCSQRLPLIDDTVVASSAWLAPIQHTGEDCWGKCAEGKSGYCAWCGQGNACCKQGFAGDPEECQHAIGFSTKFHECVSVRPQAALTGRGAPGGRLHADCSAQGSCGAGALVVATGLVSSGAVRCVALAGSGPSVGSSQSPWRLERTRRNPVVGCPAVCRSGRYIEGSSMGPCRQILSQSGHCGGSKDAGSVDCGGCSSLQAPAWEDLGLSSVQQLASAGKLALWQLPREKDVPHRGEDCWGKCSHGMSGPCDDWCGQGNACCKHGFATDPPECRRAVGFTSNHHECVRLAQAPSPKPAPPPPVATPAPAAQQLTTGRPGGLSAVAERAVKRWRTLRAASLLHVGEDCWGRCKEGMSGVCTWCGEGNACCKRGFQGDPAECERAEAFVSNHHECVRLQPEPAMLGRWAIGSIVIVSAWAAAGFGAWQLLRGKPVIQSKSLEGDVDLQWRRRNRDEAALRRELTEKAKRLTWLGFHV